MSNLPILVCSLAGFGFLLAAMGRHQPDWFGKKLATHHSLILRGGGFGLLVTAWLIAGFTQGFAYGTVVWFGGMTVTALIVIAVNVNRERLLKRFRR